MMSGSDWGHNMMSGYGFSGTLLWLLILVDLALVGVWLLKQIQKK